MLRSPAGPSAPEHSGDAEAAQQAPLCEGGRLYERFTDGSEFEIGRVLRCDPPHLILLTWKGPDWEASREVEVRFSAEAGDIRVELAAEADKDAK